MIRFDSGGGNTRSGFDLVKEYALAQVGITENPAGSNNVIYNTDYYGHVVSGPNYPWCVTFLWDIFRMAKLSLAFYGGSKTASCSALRDYYKGQNRWITTGVPRAGDIVIFNFHNGTTPEHCGLLISIDGEGVYTTVEGNTSSGIQGSLDNGGCVAKRTRYRSSIVGFCRIIYSNETTEGGAVKEDVLKDILSTSSPLYMFDTEMVTGTLTRDAITTVNREYSEIDAYSNNLLSYPSLVETPYINVTIGDYVFGKYNETVVNNLKQKVFPNFINSMTIVKTNGTVNVYTIDMLYLIKSGDDPNFLDKIFSSVGYGKIKISYGDYSSPSFVYKEEEAIITKVVSRVDFSNSSISYTISCTSSALSVMGSNFNFNFRHALPSSVIYELLVNSKRYGLDSIFPALTGENLNKNFSRFIATDDLVVDIPAKNYIDPISYINYLVSYMVPRSDPVSSTRRSATYYMTIHDDSYASVANLGGTYFKVTKINSTYTTLPTFNTYTVDVGYPGDLPGSNLVMGFTILDDNSWSLLYDYSDTNLIASQETYSYSIDRDGNIILNYSPNITLNAIHGKTTAAMKSWWTRMTEFPIKATLVIKGLIRPAILMTYLRINTYFYGKKHVSSGLYIITKQEDRIDGGGYRTTLSLTRIAGADDIIERKDYNVTSEIITHVNSIPQEVAVSEPYEREGVKGQYIGLYRVPKGCLLSVCTDYYDPPNGIYNLYMDINKKPFTDTQEEFNETNKAYKTYRTDLIYRDNPASHEQFPEGGVVTDKEYIAPAREWYNSTGNSTALIWILLDDGKLYFHSIYHEHYDPNVSEDNIYREGTELLKYSERGGR